VSEPSQVPPPVDGLRREVEVMFDGRRRVTYYSRASEYEAAASSGLRSAFDGVRDEGANAVERATREGEADSGLARASKRAQ
jgi:hypothetical protein